MVAMLPNARMQLQPLFVSLVRRMMATLINCVVEKTIAHSDDTDSDNIMSVALSPDGTKIVSGSGDKTIKVWDSGAPEPSNSPPPWPTLTPAGLSDSQTGAAEREDERAQRMDHISGVFTGRDQDRVGIV
jgi:hypothetical protein